MGIEINHDCFTGVYSTKYTFDPKEALKNFPPLPEIICTNADSITEFFKSIIKPKKSDEEAPKHKTKRKSTEQLLNELMIQSIGETLTVLPECTSYIDMVTVLHNVITLCMDREHEILDGRKIEILSTLRKRHEHQMRYVHA